MADSKRLLILKALSAQLATISPANGYQHDLSEAGRVTRGRITFSGDEPLPAINILEALNPDREPQRVGDRTLQRDSWTLLLQGWAEDDENNPTDPAHLLMADVKKCLARIGSDDELGEPHYMLGGLITGILLEPGTVRPPDENSTRAYFYLRVVLEVVENMVDPYHVG